MKLTLETPIGQGSATVDDVIIDNAQVDPDGTVSISFFPREDPNCENYDFIGD